MNLKGVLIVPVVMLAIFFATDILLRRVLAWLHHHAVLDRPVERSLHRAPTPRGGGLALIPVVLVAWALLGQSIGIVALAAGLAILSWRDDLHHVPVLWRLLAQLAAAAIGTYFFLDAGGGPVGFSPLWFERALLALLWVWFTNLYNFMDGIDGITGIETASLGGGIALVSALGASTLADPLPALVLEAASLAFLRWNWYPAVIFLGDVGSIPLGFLSGYLLIRLALLGFWASALILPLYYLSDASVTLLGRILRGEPIWQAHRLHFYQRAAASDGDHAAVARIVLFGNLALIALAALAIYRPLPALAAAGVVTVMMLAVLQIRAKRRV
ncbi:MAG TPA: glycosyltransferase family 4 protein [Stellaceae bacterium]|nr:glycosyltransferase family 4 protein [Stellaceae bacterium]